MNLSKLTISELIDYEKAARLVCGKYENELKSYDGSIVGNTTSVMEFEEFNKKHNKIMDEIKSRVEEI